MLGALLFLGLLAANVAAYFVGPEGSRLELQYEPPHPLALRALLWRSDARVEVRHELGNQVDTAATIVFRSTPSPIARPGQSYSYVPRTAQPLNDYSLRGGPDGLNVDAGNGSIAGTPTEQGKFTIELEGRLADGRVATQTYTLYVDDRRLLLGADKFGADLLRRLFTSARYTLVPGSIAVVIGVAGGVLLGALGGFYGGASRRLLLALTTVLQSIPGLLIIFLAAVLSSFNLYFTMATVGLVLLPETANGIAERVESFRKREFVEAARELGMRDRAILWNEILWHNARSFVLSHVMQGFAFAILVEVTLAYMGLMQNDASLGHILLEAKEASTGGTTNVQTVVGLAALTLLIATLSLLERGIRGLWERQR
jgi:peptide/nickel transport system permease protein